MEQFLMSFFVQNGLGWAVAGAMVCVMFGGWGSARGLRIPGPMKLNSTSGCARSTSKSV